MSALSRTWKAVSSIKLHWRIMAGLVLGGLTGALGGERVAFLGDIGDVFLRALNMVIVPLIATSIVAGVAGLGSGRKLGTLGLKTMGYYLVTSTLAILTGLVLVNTIKPGVGADLGISGEVPEGIEGPISSVTDFLMRLIPQNPIGAMAEGRILPVIFFCILFGAFVAQLDPDRRRTMSQWFDSAFDVMMRLTRFVIAFAPLGVFGLIAKTTATVGFAPLKSLGIYALTVMIGLTVHFFLTLPLLHWLVARSNPFRFLKQMSPALIMAFSTASSSATLPLTMDCAKNRAGVSKGVTSFVLPLGATVNMDGTALYECVAAIFIVQVLGITLTAGEQFLVVATSLLASIGAAGIPMAGLVMIGVILTAIGVPIKYIGLIIAIDPLLDMCRTSVNVWSDSNGAAIVARSEGERLDSGS
ncbi:MAG: dicarboxylate/amino acid:cation symporter [Deltaproteobacteria bacterium]|nr:dicarboxylate/amino acid:cation symporter [Deltaproteobacteria bacterium]